MRGQNCMFFIKCLGEWLRITFKLINACHCHCVVASVQPTAMSITQGLAFEICLMSDVSHGFETRPVGHGWISAISLAAERK